MVDFCCGSNDFSCLMKDALDKLGRKCSFKNYDLMQPKVQIRHIILALLSTNCSLRHFFLGLTLDASSWCCSNSDCLQNVVSSIVIILAIFLWNKAVFLSIFTLPLRVRIGKVGLLFIECDIYIKFLWGGVTALIPFLSQRITQKNAFYSARI